MTDEPIPCCCDLHPGRGCCSTHGDEDLSPELFPDPRTTTDVPF